LKFLLDLRLTKVAGSTGVVGGATVGLYVNGALKVTRTIPTLPEPRPDTLDIEVKEAQSVPDTNGTFEWKLNGVSIATGTFAPDQFFLDETIISTVSATDPGGSAEVVPSGVQGTEQATVEEHPNGDETTTTKTDPPGAAPPKTVVDTNFADGATLTDAMNKEDFYEAFKQALRDATTESKAEDKETFSGPVATADPALVVIDVTNRGNIDNMSGKIDLVKTKTGETKTSFKGKVTTPLQSKVNAIPTSFGTVSSHSVGSFNMAGTVMPLSIDFATGPLATAVSALRAAALFVLSVGWVALCVTTVRGYL
jgi:hypothetical protein